MARREHVLVYNFPFHSHRSPRNAKERATLLSSYFLSLYIPLDNFSLTYSPISLSLLQKVSLLIQQLGVYHFQPLCVLFNMERILVFNIFCLALLIVLPPIWAEDNLISPSKLEKFVDELPDMPKIQSFEVVNGVFKSKPLEIGMFKKQWVRSLCLYFFAVRV